MERFKKICMALLFPHIALLWLITPISIFALVYSMLAFGEGSPISIIAYVLSAYTLTAWCVRIPRIIDFFKGFKENNALARRYFSDARFRVNLSLAISLIMNIAYALFQLSLGIYQGSFWYYSLAAYYLSLVAVRLYLSVYTQRNNPGENLIAETKSYIISGWMLFALNIALSGITFFMIYLKRTFVRGEIMTIAMAAYTFLSLVLAIVGLVRYRKYNSPVFSATKVIGLAAASVSMLTLTSTMLTTFGEGEDTFTFIMLTLLGTAVAIFTVAAALYMIILGNKKLKEYKNG